jgi:DNA-binding LacI/PurR family transcriptional regulator
VDIAERGPLSAAAHEPAAVLGAPVRRAPIRTPSTGASVRTKAHIRDVARAAGVSHQTVSRVLNNQPMVRPETRDRVLTAIRELDYRPSHTARALVTGRTGAVGVITFDTFRYGPASTLEGIGLAARDVGYLVSTVALRSPERWAVIEAIERLTDQAVDGIIVIASQKSVIRSIAEASHRVPMVMLDNSFNDGIPVVSTAEAEGARQATEHLLQLGHKTVWHLAGPHDWVAAEGRIPGWRDALVAAGAPVPEPVYGDWSAGSGYELGHQLAARPEVTAIFAANDQMALGLLQALHEAGRRVPEDVSVVGFDDIPEAPYLMPPLTTVRPDFAAVGRHCLSTVLEQLKPDAAPNPHTVVPTTLIVRRSSGPPPD